MKNKKGIFINFGYDFEYTEYLDMIANEDFDSVMVWFGDGNEKDVVSYARDKGLYVSNAHLPFKDINCMWEDGEKGDIMTDSLCRLVRLSGEIFVPVAVIHISSGFTPPQYCEKGLKRFERIVRSAEECGVDLAFENLRRLDYLDYIYDNIKSDRVKFCYDSGHHNYLYPEVDVLAKYGDKLVATHFHDITGEYDWHMLPFDGTVEWRRVYNGIAVLNYEGAISLEVHQNVHNKYEKTEPSVFIKQASERLNVIYSEIRNMKNLDK